MTYNLPTPSHPMNIGTRGSPLALAQAHETRERLAKSFDLPFEAFTIVVIKTPDNQGVVEVYNLKTIVSWGAKNSDLLLIIYIFLSLQLAGLSEFKQRQDYLTVALISLVFTPIGLLFIKDEKEKRDE